MNKRRGILGQLSLFWLGFVWLALFVVHFALIMTNVPMDGVLTYFDSVVMTSCFIIYGMLDTGVFNYQAVLAISVQFGFWALIGIFLRWAWFKFEKDLRKLTGKSKA